MKKRIFAIFLASLLALIVVLHAGAQSSESIWLTASATAYKTGETVLATVNATSATPIQGFTFQIRYDPACLKPVNASSPVPGMSGLPLPQLTGLVDGSYASTTPQQVNGVLAEVRFTALAGCQTSVTLESAALAIRNAEGYAAPLTSVLVGERNVSYYIDPEAVAPQAAGPDSGALLPLDPPEINQGIPPWIIGVSIGLLVSLLMFGAYKVFRIGSAN